MRNGFTENKQLEIAEDITELKLRVMEDETVGDMLAEGDAGSHSKKQMKELRELLSGAKKQVEKAERLLKEMIGEREKENLNIEDAILLSDGVMKVREQEAEHVPEKELEKDVE